MMIKNICESFSNILDISLAVVGIILAPLAAIFDALDQFSWLTTISLVYMSLFCCKVVYSQIYIMNILQKQVENLTFENEKLSNSVNQLELTKNKLNEEVQKLEGIEDNLILENKKLQNNIDSFETSLDNFKAENIKLKETQDNLKEVYAKSMQLVKSLTSFGDTSDDLKITADGLSDTKEDLEKTVKMLNNLVGKIQEDKFALFDLDHDGFVTFDEFKKGIKQL